jgi:hypothetical protein
LENGVALERQKKPETEALRPTSVADLRARIHASDSRTRADRDPMLRARSFGRSSRRYGRFDEFFEALCMIRTGKREPLRVILVGAEFWRRAVDFDLLAEEAMVMPSDRDLFDFAETAEEAWQKILRWYEERDLSLFDTATEVSRPESTT